MPRGREQIHCRRDIRRWSVAPTACDATYRVLVARAAGFFADREPRVDRAAPGRPLVLRAEAFLELFAPRFALPAFSLSAACAAAKRAIGTLYGEHDT